MSLSKEGVVNSVVGVLAQVTLQLVFNLKRQEYHPLWQG